MKKATFFLTLCLALFCWTGIASAQITQGVVSRDGWTLSSPAAPTSDIEGNGSGKLERAFDGNESTYYHSDWYTGSGSALPQYFIIDMGATVSDIEGFAYLPRPDNGNGTSTRMRVYFSDSEFNVSGGVSKENLSSYTLAAEATFSYGGSREYKLAPFDTKQSGRYVLVVSDASTNGTYFTCAEFYLFNDMNSYVKPKLSELITADYSASTNEAKVGYYNPTDLNSFISNMTDIYNNATYSEVFNAYTNFSSRLLSCLNMPEAGKVYRIVNCYTEYHNKQSVEKAMYANGTTPYWANDATDNLAYCWAVAPMGDGTYSIRNLNNCQYIQATNAMGSSATGLNLVWLAAGQFNIKKGNESAFHTNGHSNGDGVSGNIVGWNGGANSASSWRFEEMTADATDLVDAELSALVSDNASNHAAVPALGQYTDAAYTALTEAQTAYNESSKTADDMFTAQMAVLEFNQLYNRSLPVFTINGTIAYAAGKAIYDDNRDQLHFTTSSTANKKMLWVMEGLNASTMAAGKYVAKNLYTGKNFWGSNNIVVTAIADTDPQQFYFKTNGEGKPVHAQNDYQVIVRWQDTAANTGSAWTFNYVGTTIDLLSSESEALYAAYDGMLASTSALAPYNGLIGTGLNQYGGATSEEVSTLCNETTNRALSTLEAINEKKTAIDNTLTSLSLNLPAAGKLYRFKGTTSSKYMVSTVSETEGKTSQLGMVEANNTRESVFYYDGTNLVAYADGLCVGAFAQEGGVNGGSWKCVPVGGTAGVVSFGEGHTKGTYYIRMGSNRNLYDGSTYVDCGGTTADNNYRWTIEEVQYLPVAVSSEVGYGTLYAPVDLALRENLAAYTATVNGSSLQLQAVTDKIPAGTAVILKDNGAVRDANTNCIYLQVTSEATAVSSNDLTGTYKAIAKPAAGSVKIYTLQNPEAGIGFYKYTGANLGGFKAYLSLVSSQANGLSFDFGAATGLDNVATELPADAPAYDLTGRRVNKNTKGIIIVGNKKVINL
ncbi:MAG: discoidin domain-containing protein [Bacteroidales bacterium]|nr:discoidin domain-containing protein [Bacteroidales bacterium]